MDFIVRNLYLNLNPGEYLSWASEGLVAWTVKILGHFNRILFNETIINCSQMIADKTSLSNYSQYRGSSFDADKCERFFQELTNGEEERLEYSELEDLALKICSNEHDPRRFNIIIILSYKMKTRCFVSWTKKEWIRGMAELGIHSMEQLLTHRDDLLNVVEDEAAMREVWRYCFDAGKGESKDMGTPFVEALVDAFFADRWTFFKDFFCYLDKMKIKHLTKDQFCSLYDFQKCVNSKKDLSEYDFEGAWPTLLDEFVEFIKHRSFDAELCCT